MSDVRIEGLTKRYGEVTVLHGIDLSIDSGEFLTLLGPSGCGKSTTLFALAGLDVPSGGRIEVDGQTFYDGASGVCVPPEARNLGLVFQSYALWPHMSVADNLAFPLKLRKIARAERRERIEEALDLVDMGRFATRFPHELSGGQQQRVALARTLVFRPSLLLLDEPLSNLDAKLRIKSRSLLKNLQRRLGLTTVYVTHDQEEALAMSDRIAVMDAGRIIQLDRPEAIFSRPASKFVAEFVGAGNFLPVEAQGGEAGALVDASFASDVVLRAVRTHASNTGTSCLSVRPQFIRLSKDNGDAARQVNHLAGIIEQRTYLGTRHGYAVRVGEHMLSVETEDMFEPGPVTLSFDPRDALLLEN